MDINLEFIDFKPTPTGKAEGIASIRLATGVGGIVFRFHIMRSKKGDTFYHSSMGYKVSGHGQDIYLMPFHFEDPRVDEEIEKVLKEKVYGALT